MDRVDCVVVGAGVVGLAIARALSLTGREVVVLEAEAAIGTGTSSRNSEVVHAGIYYPAGSSKARFCVSGRERLYDYCATRAVPHRKLGKLIVATDETQLSALETIRERAAANGVADLTFVGEAEARAMEPALACRGALLSPSTGIVDSHSLMLSLRGEAEENGAMIALRSPLHAAWPENGGIVLDVGGAEPMRIACGALVNAAGLGAWAVAGAVEGLRPGSLPKRRFAKGNYYALSGRRAPFSRLIYPVPEDGGLGVHLTLDLSGDARFGPDVEWLDETPTRRPEAGPEPFDYRVDPKRSEGFYASIRRYWPDLPDDSLVPAYSGIRPKLGGPGEPAADFLIQDEADHGVRGLVNLFGIESPGLTSSLALADEVIERVERARS
ncbi:NAD(P)/FAD-dependent oxidoreductase [Fulvimarina endophytica]|uniref:NAD(P)/FAD-dependent oxidoreductase n=1 Tax=Fulvimarina endophytica TaxID=2293836 RepID=A0A371X3B1_9HYPH|nr:NAD(P)/FAD-dependent oxidoreductase [Fulvimarina endophytica]RFC63721.1 NAD(P)/FAD-dependent oxidoreductase [Fulvimarina endophytica]